MVIRFIKKFTTFFKKLFSIFFIITLSNSNVFAEPTHVDSYGIGSQEATITGIAFNPDGTKMFIVGIGGDPINGCSFRDVLEKFEQDEQTKAILMIGEIGGPQEVEAGKFAKENMSKPVVAYIAGLTAPKGRVMGHAGAIVSAYGESAVEKVELLKECGVTISKNPSVMGETVKLVLNGKKN